VRLETTADRVELSPDQRAQALLSQLRSRTSHVPLSHPDALEVGRQNCEADGGCIDKTPPVWLAILLVILAGSTCATAVKKAEETKKDKQE
jgi:hypothetical protein